MTRVVQVQINEHVKASGGLDISLATLSLLRLLQANPGIRQVDVARILMIQESNTASLVKSLVNKGLIEIYRDESTRRGLRVTKAGEREIEKWSVTSEMDRSFASVLSDKEYRQLLALLDRVYKSRLDELSKT
ncbi:MAG: MarR family winged helix-turn-helix transcriptional regulator [Cellvibrionaceae bacterium]|nr:MarR family winged helix-turn-helix transcriptional regulator [Cellvibrionaceae bacterium]